MENKHRWIWTWKDPQVTSQHHAKPRSTMSSTPGSPQTWAGSSPQLEAEPWAEIAEGMVLRNRTVPAPIGQRAPSDLHHETEKSVFAEIHLHVCNRCLWVWLNWDCALLMRLVEQWRNSPKEPSHCACTDMMGHRFGTWAPYQQLHELRCKSSSWLRQQPTLLTPDEQSQTREPQCLASKCSCFPGEQHFLINKT